MNKQFYATLFMYLSVLVAQSQTYSYKKVFDNPQHPKNFTVGVYTGYDFSLPDIVMGGQANYMLSRLSLEAKFSKGFANTIFQSDKDSAVAQGLNANSLTELTAAIHLVDKIKSGKYKYILSVNSDGVVQTTNFLPIPIYERKIFGIRGGLMYTRRNTSTKVFSSTGTIEGRNYYNVNSTIIYGGLLFKKVRSFKVGVEGFSRKKGIQQMREFYMDFMFAPLTNINPARVADDNRSSIVIRNMGGRMGWQWRSTRAFGGNFRLEFGLLPGVVIPKSELYALMTFGFNISARIDKKGDDVYKD